MFKVMLSLFAMISVSAYAGDNGGGSLDCRSDSGRTTVKGMAGVSWNGDGPAALTYTIDGAQVTFDTYQPVAPETHMVDYVVYVNKLSYTVGIKRSQVYSTDMGPRIYSVGMFQMRSLPGTFAQIRPEVYRFKAVIPEFSSIDPRKGTDLNADLQLFDQPIQVNCVLDLSI
jgi:hypothetical protein